MQSSGKPSGQGQRVGPAGAQVIRRRPARASTGAGNNRLMSGMQSMYDEEAPGLKIPPVVVLLMSCGFIVLVASMHIIGKVRPTGAVARP